MTIEKAVLEELTKDCQTPEDVDRLYGQLLQHMINRSLAAELDVHLERPGEEVRSNKRNGRTSKRVQSLSGPLTIETPRDRNASFEPHLVKKRQVRLAGMEEKILALYAKGMTTRDIEDALVELYGVTISHNVISQVTEVVLDEARAWQNRPLEAIYPIVWLDGLVVKVRQNKQVINKSVHS